MDANAGEVVRLCDEANLPVSDSVGGLKIAQKSTIIGGQSRNQSTLLVAIATDDESGKLLSHPDGKPLSQLSQYRFENDVLTITTELDGLRAEERWWFITDKLRMRTHVLSDKEGQTMASFCSEIRLGDVSA